MEPRGNPALTSRPFHAGRASEEIPRELASELAATVAACHARGWCQGTAGNFSAVIRRQPLALLITPSGIDKGGVRPGDLLVVGGDGRPVSAAQGNQAARPSAETLLHCAIVQTLAAGAVL